jgi:hypothetical protein
MMRRKVGSDDEAGPTNAGQPALPLHAMRLTHAANAAYKGWMPAPQNRPVRLVEPGQPIGELFG